MRGCLNYIRCAAHGLLYLPETDRGTGTGEGELALSLLCFALLCFAELDADADVDVGKAAHVLEKYALEEVLFHYVCVFLCVCVWVLDLCGSSYLYA